MVKLVTEPNSSRPDDIYAALLAAHDGLNDSDSAALNMKLVLLLANHIGDVEILRHAITAASATSKR
jgi:hypothetical protein